VEEFDAIIIGAGAAGLICAAIAGQQGRRVLVIDHADQAGNKIRISGGGRCNFSNAKVSASNYISNNSHFCKSALSRYTPDDFISLLLAYGVKYEERKLGQLFCLGKADQVVEMLLSECKKGRVTIKLDCRIDQIVHNQDIYQVEGTKGKFGAPKLVVATGGLSLPKLGATNFAYKVAKQFEVAVVECQPALVPLTFSAYDLEFMSKLSGISMECQISCKGRVFNEQLLFTHRGLSGPAVLQISSYWQAGDSINIHLQPSVDIVEILRQSRVSRPKANLKSLLCEHYPRRFVEQLITDGLTNNKIGETTKESLEQISARTVNWQVNPASSEGYRSAEVTRGGVSTQMLSSKTMECKQKPGLYFIGECVDVTGWLGGYNFQWAWSSGWACGMAL
jgi:predicted Rossmann fold flavoprotein